jgi:hypothetical protein
MFYTNILYHSIGFDLKTSPTKQNIALTTSIPLGTKEHDLFFRFITYTKLKRKKNLMPCNGTTQFFAGLHCQAHKKNANKQI